MFRRSIWRIAEGASGPQPQGPSPEAARSPGRACPGSVPLCLRLATRRLCAGGGGQITGITLRTVRLDSSFLFPPFSCAV